MNSLLGTQRMPLTSGCLNQERADGGEEILPGPVPAEHLRSRVAGGDIASPLTALSQGGHQPKEPTPGGPDLARLAGPGVRALCPPCGVSPAHPCLGFAFPGLRKGRRRVRSRRVGLYKSGGGGPARVHSLPRRLSKRHTPPSGRAAGGLAGWHGRCALATQCVDYPQPLPVQYAGAPEQLNGVAATPLPGLDLSAAFPYEEDTSE